MYVCTTTSMSTSRTSRHSDLASSSTTCDRRAANGSAGSNTRGCYHHHPQPSFDCFSPIFSEPEFIITHSGSLTGIQAHHRQMVSQETIDTTCRDCFSRDSSSFSGMAPSKPVSISPTRPATCSQASQEPHVSAVVSGGGHCGQGQRHSLHVSYHQ